MELVALIAIGVLVLWNVVTFLMYSIDKRRAKTNAWRIKESTLIAVAFLMGGVGAFLGMMLLRHKTKHLKFRLLVPLGVIVNIGVIVLLCYNF